MKIDNDDTESIEGADIKSLLKKALLLKGSLHTDSGGVAFVRM